MGKPEVRDPLPVLPVGLECLDYVVGVVVVQHLPLSRGWLARVGLEDEHGHVIFVRVGVEVAFVLGVPVDVFQEQGGLANPAKYRSSRRGLTHSKRTCSTPMTSTKTPGE